jgi:hypothetical protein
MVTVLLIYMLAANEHHVPDVPKFYAVYRNEAACKSAAQKYIALSGQEHILINARCVDARHPDLLPMLHDVTELQAIEESEA